jgi:hypothetical protein
MTTTTPPISGFVHAAPAPIVDPAVADKAPVEDAAVADGAVPTDAAIADRPSIVEPAVPFDNPMKYAPDCVRNPKISKSSVLSVNALRKQCKEDAKNGTVEKTTTTYFESYAAVIQGTPSKNIFRRCLPCMLDERDFVSYGEVRKYIFVTSPKGSCFIYGDIIDPTPLYGINLVDYIAVREDPNQPDSNSFTISPVPNTNKPRDELVTILLKTKSDLKQAYQFTFDTTNDTSLPDRFLSLFDNDTTNTNIQLPGSHAVISSNEQVKKVKEKE